MKYTFIMAAMLAAFCIVGCNTNEGSAEKPDDNRFTKVVLAERLEEPMQFQVLKDGRVLIAERKGKLKVYDPISKDVKVIANLSVSTKYVSKEGEISEGEDGVQGVILDPDYENNHWIYIYYSPAGEPARNSLERYEWKGDELLLSTKKVVLEIPTQREECCHVGGGMVFDQDKNLYLSTGDNTFSRASDGFSPLDERPGNSARDAQKSSSNTNDLRGKILRIHPEKDGTYSIPTGNLFPEGTPNTRAEIYTMGNRNPWRLSVDSKTGWLYWGEVGPDGSKDDFENRGPQSYDEFNRAKAPGNYGWPYFSADNKAYNEFDFETGTSGEFYNPDRPINNSPNNTGIQELPNAIPAMIWYGKSESEEFPELGNGGGNSAVGGPIYRRADFHNAKRPFPKYYEGKWFITDFVRGWINVVEFDEQGEYKAMERFLPDLKLSGPLDLKFGPEGDLYALEYGQGYFKDNPEAQLVRIEYNGNNRKPQVELSVSRSAGAVPLTVELSSEGTVDFDAGDELSFEWKITKDAADYRSFTELNPEITFDTPGIYTVTLTVSDQKGESNSRSVEIAAGNEPPQVSIQVTEGNSMFFLPGKKISYEVTVSDKEDGSLEDGRIAASQVSVSTNYFSEGFNPTVIAQNQLRVDASVQYAGAISFINSSDCNSCHAVEETVLGPSFTDVAKKYKGDPTATKHLANVLTKGGSGVWGTLQMPAHPNMSDADLKAVIKYILNSDTPPLPAETLPVKGTYKTDVPAGENEDGSFVFRAAYTDKAVNAVPEQTSEAILVLNKPFLTAWDANEKEHVDFNGYFFTAKENAVIQYNAIDLTGVTKIEVLRIIHDSKDAPKPVKGGVEVRKGSPQGELIGKFNGSYTGLKSLPILLKNEYSTTDLFFLFTGDPMDLDKIKFN